MDGVSSRLSDDILSILAGAVDERIAVSDLLNSLRRSGRGSAVSDSGRRWKGIGTTSELERLCRKLGFEVFDSRSERNQRATFVGVVKSHPYAVQGPRRTAEGEAPTGYAVYIAATHSGYLPRFKANYNFGRVSDVARAKTWKTEAGARKAGERSASRGRGVVEVRPVVVPE